MSSEKHPSAEGADKSPENQPLREATEYLLSLIPDRFRQEKCYPNFVMAMEEGFADKDPGQSYLLSTGAYVIQGIAERFPEVLEKAMNDLFLDFFFLDLGLESQTTEDERACASKNFVYDFLSILIGNMPGTYTTAEEFKPVYNISSDRQKFEAAKYTHFLRNSNLDRAVIKDEALRALLDRSEEPSKVSLKNKDPEELRDDTIYVENASKLTEGKVFVPQVNLAVEWRGRKFFLRREVEADGATWQLLPRYIDENSSFLILDPRPFYHVSSELSDLLNEAIEDEGGIQPVEIKDSRARKIFKKHMSSESWRDAMLEEGIATEKEIPYIPTRLEENVEAVGQAIFEFRKGLLRRLPRLITGAAVVGLSLIVPTFSVDDKKVKRPPFSWITNDAGAKDANHKLKPKPRASFSYDIVEPEPEQKVPLKEFMHWIQQHLAKQHGLFIRNKEGYEDFRKIYKACTKKEYQFTYKETLDFLTELSTGKKGYMKIISKLGIRKVDDKIRSQISGNIPSWPPPGILDNSDR